jgi:hypothetical protein
MTPKAGDHVDYHSPFRIGVFPAVITRVNDDGTVAIDVAILPHDSVHLRAVSYGPEGRAKPSI